MGDWEGLRIRKLRIAVLDIVARAPTRALYARVMHANLASIMPQVIAVWCEDLGHEVWLECYTGFENLQKILPQDIDVLFIGAFTQAAQLSYAISAEFRERGVVTVLGGPHARCYPQDSQKYFDYVLGFTDKETLREVLSDVTPNRPLGVHLTAKRQPPSLPGVRERWKFIEPTLRKAPAFKIIPMLGSLGCPYTCSFCIDSTVAYQPLAQAQIQDDLRFVMTKMHRPRVAWHDPNFGVRFTEQMDAIEAAIPPGSIDFLAESSLTLLSEPHLKRLKRNGFKAILPGIESWYDMGNKANARSVRGLDKVNQISAHVNMVMDYIPYVQTNFVLGLDSDEGDEPFQLTKMFVDKTPGAFPGYSLLTAFGQAAPLNLDLQRAGRVNGFPFHFLNNNHAMNVRPKHYAWDRFYDHVIDLTKYTFSWRAVARRFQANQETIPRWMNVVRAVSTEGSGRIQYHTEIRRRLEHDRPFRRYFEGESETLPDFYVDRVKRDLGSFWHHLPEGALYHDAQAYLNSQPRVPIALSPASLAPSATA